MDKHIGVIMNGVTGRMGTNQHLIRSVLAIRDQGGATLKSGDRIIPEPILVGRNEAKLSRLASAHGVEKFTTNLDEALADSNAPIYFDSATTERRIEGVSRAIDAGKAIYCEKPTATSLEGALGLYHKAREAGVKHGVVQDKLWLPGLLKLKYLIDTGFFGQILSVRGEFGYWVFDGVHQATQRPSWNYRKEDGGGIMIDMFCHWRYVIDNLFGPIARLSAIGATHIPERVGEDGKPYACTADDSAYGTFELSNGVICQFNSSWVVRVRRDDLLTLQVDGTEGTAVAGLTECRVQSDATTPKPVWNPDIESPIDYFKDWSLVPNRDPAVNAFKAQWELYFRH
ncbi:MAG: Gfo/Idh/MocA family oxidoreductase, partial [Spirochaetales bacterium]